MPELIFTNLSIKCVPIQLLFSLIMIVTLTNNIWVFHLFTQCFEALQGLFFD